MQKQRGTVNGRPSLYKLKPNLVTLYYENKIADYDLLKSFLNIEVSSSFLASSE
jgi:hypothetical protein